jgi:glycosyltransferase involved in cell wall biosynthesis
MKIGLIGYEANVKNRVGSNRYAFELLKAIYRLDKINNYVVYLPEVPLADLPKARANWRYRVVGPKKGWNFLGLPLALLRERPKLDLIFNPGHYLPLVIPCPAVVAVMDLGFLRFPEQFTKEIFWQLKYWTWWSVKRAKRVLAISEATKKDLVRFYNLPVDKIVVAYPGVKQKKSEIRNLKFETEKIKKKYGIEGEYILSVGTLKPNKNIEGLLESFRVLIDQGWHGQLVVAGRKGWLFESIGQRVVELSLQGRVILTGFVPEEEIPILMGSAQVLVVPSFWEGFGIPAVEAMSLGVPVVAAEVGSLPEVVGEAGVLVDPYRSRSIAEGIKEAVSRQKELREKGLKQARKFAWERTARLTLEVLNDVVSR